MSRPGLFPLLCLLALALAVAACAPAGGREEPPAVPDSPLRNTYWKLVELRGEPVTAADNQREPHLIFAQDQLRVAGSGGCNRIMGSFELKGDSLRLGQLAGTMMACPQGMELEQQFLRTLTAVAGYRIAGDRLALLDDSGAAVARFQAVALR